jgi:hypothetical protein
MLRASPVRAAFGALLTATLFVAVGAACWLSPFDPKCSKKEDVEKFEAIRIDKNAWNVVAVDNNARPSPGWNLPLTDDKLSSGSLGFNISRRFGPCDDIERVEGIATVRYTLNNENGSFKKRQSFSGRFIHNVKKGTVILRVPKEQENNKFGIQQITGTVSGSTLEFTNLPPWDNSLRFQKIQSN